MIKKLLLLITAGTMLSGCIIITPLALVGPATQGFSTASLVQTGVTQTANFIIKEKTGKTINGHAWSAVEDNLITPTVRRVILQQAYFPTYQTIDLEIAP